MFVPSTQWSLSVDYWNIAKKDVISTLGEQIIIGICPFRHFWMVLHFFSSFFPHYLPKKFLRRLKLLSRKVPVMVL